MSRYVCFFTCVRLCPSSQKRRHSLSCLRELFFKSSPSLCKLSHWHLSAVSWSSSVWQGESLRKPNSILIGQRLFSRRRLRSINASLGLSLFSAATSSHLSIQKVYRQNTCRVFKLNCLPSVSFCHHPYTHITLIFTRLLDLTSAICVLLCFL